MPKRTVKKLKQQIVSATKTLNSRLRRLRAEDLPATTEHNIHELGLLRPGFVTESGYISAATAGMEWDELKEKLDTIRGLIKETETVKQARENVERKMKQWNVSKQEAKRRIKQSRVFYQILGYRGGIFESDDIKTAIESFDKTPNYDQLLDEMFLRFGVEMQNERAARGLLLEWMNNKNIIPLGVSAVKDMKTGRIYYGHFDEQGNMILDREQG